MFELSRMEVNSVNKPLMTVMINNSPVKVLGYTGSSKYLLGEETFNSLKETPNEYHGA